MLKFGRLKALADIYDIFKSLRDEIFTFFLGIKLYFKRKKSLRFLKDLKCNKIHIKENYIHLDYTHLDIEPYYGVFIEDNHRLFDKYPRIIFADNTDIEKYVDNIFNGVICAVEYYPLDLNKSIDIKLEDKFHSIALNFALDKVKEDDLERFIKQIRTLLLDGGVVFGVTVCNDLNHSNTGLKYIQKQNDLKIWHNKNRNTTNLEDLFQKYFDQVIVENIGSCLLFVLSLDKPKLNYEPIIQNMWQDGKYLEIPKPNLIK